MYCLEISSIKLDVELYFSVLSHLDLSVSHQEIPVQIRAKATSRKKKEMTIMGFTIANIGHVQRIVNKRWNNN